MLLILGWAALLFISNNYIFLPYNTQHQCLKIAKLLVSFL
jgi:hypothetical protein